MTKRIRAVAFFAVLTACGRRQEPAKLTIAAAADLNFALEEVSQAFRAAHPAIATAVSYGSSGNFYTQIRSGAPFDIFLSADIAYPRKLAQEGHGLADSIFVYGVGRIAIWVPAKSALDPATALTAPEVKHVAIANPQHAPYGRAAEAAMRSMGVWEQVQPKLVLGENIAQTLQFVQSGAVDVGIVALSLATAPKVKDAGRYREIPLDRYPKIEQGGIIVKDSPASRAFRDFLLAPQGRDILKRYGFYLPGA